MPDRRGEIILIGGVSGSGKSVALTAFEDAGYYPVGNLPLSLILETAEYLSASGQKHIATTFDVRTSGGVDGLEAAIAALRSARWAVRLVMLDAKTDTLVKRFSETRRRHPFTTDTRTLTEAIEFERSLIASARDLGPVVDTSDLPTAALRAWIKDFLSTDPRRLTLLLESFGFKHGIPLDADLVFDVRCLPNPHYEPELAPLTGRDEPVVAFLERLPEVERMYSDIYHFVAGWLPDYARDNRNYLTVAIGCTGGQHRSVYFVERLAQAFASRYQVQTRHREIGAAA